MTISSLTTNNLQQLTEQIKTICSAIEGDIGICAVYPPAHWQFGQNESKKFFMASTYKVPIAVYCLHLVDIGKLQLHQMFTMEAQDLSAGGGILHKHFEPNGIMLSLANLLRLMLEISDNTATDIILRICGGPQQVTQYLQSNNIKDIGVDRATKEVFASKITPAPDNTQDMTTPAAMTHLLLQILHRNLLSEQCTQFLLATMQRCKTGLARIPALLPATIKIAQKTGSTSVVTNDIGIIELPASLGHLILTVYVHAAHAPVAKREETIALIAKTLFNYVGCNFNRPSTMSN